MSRFLQQRFQPREGALLDLESLQTIAAGPERNLLAGLHVDWPGANGLVLSGLEPEGDWSPHGPPGSLRPDGLGESITIKPGRAILTDPAGRPFVLDVTEPQTVPWPSREGAAVRGALVLLPDVEPGATAGGLSAARDHVGARLGFVRPGQLDHPGVLVLARALGNSRDWATDEARIWQPEHPAVRLLLRRFTTLEASVWKAQPEGAVWDRQVLGRNWVRYQTVAASALQSARMQLGIHAMNTLQRVRLMAALRAQLAGSVDAVATELLQLVGDRNEAGPYAIVHDAEE